MDELLNLPHDTEAEQGVIGSIILDAKSFEEAMLLLEGDDFYIPLHKEIFDTVYTMFSAGQVVDPVTIMTEMKSRGSYRDPDTRNYFTQLMRDTPTASHIRAYAQTVKEFSMKRRILRTMDEVTEMTREPGATASAVIDAAESKLFSIRSGQAADSLKPIPEVMYSLMLTIKQRFDEGSGMPGLPSGIGHLDALLGGLINSNFILIAARPGVGKTSLALNMATHVARYTQKEVVFFSLEMSREQLALRILSSDSRIESDRLLRGQLEERHWPMMAGSASQLSRLPMRFDDNSAITTGEMKAKCRRVKNLGMIVIDYLQLMQGTPGKNYGSRVNEVGDISRQLKIMAKELNVPVLCLSQLSRESEKQEREIRMSDLRESGSIEQDADVILFLKRGSAMTADTLNENEVELSVAKNRHGSTGKIKLEWNGSTTTFVQKDWV